MSLFSCNAQKKEEKLPKVEFDFSNMPENYKAKPFTYLNDLDKTFTLEQNEELEKLLVKLLKENGKQIIILINPSREKLNKEWSIVNVLGTNSGIIITLNKSLKNIGIGIAMDTKDILLKQTRKEIIENIMIPEFKNGNYYNGINKGIEEILKQWK